MISNKKKFTIFILLLIPSILFSASVKKDKYHINPTVQYFDSFPNISTNMKWFVSSVENMATQDTSGIIGYTRTGIKTKAPIICTPSLSVAVKNSLQNLLAHKKVVTNDVSTANFIIRVSILNFSLTEKSSVFTQSLSSRIKLEIKLIDPLDTNRVRKFIVESENTQTALDTSKYAESIVGGVLEDALKEIWKTINK